MDREQRGPVRVRRLSTADAQRERSQAFRSPSVSSNISIHLPFASPRSNVYLSTARPGYIQRPRTHTNQYRKRLNFGQTVVSPGIKPLLLQQVEKHLEKADLPEYKEIGERRLRIFQEGFGMFIAAFGVYRPVLSRIKYEYQALFDAYTKQIRYIPQLKSRLMTMKDEADAKICSVTNQLKKEKVELEQTAIKQTIICQAVQGDIESLKHEIVDLQKTIEKLREQRDAECETKKTLGIALDRYKSMLDEANEQKMQFSRALVEANRKAFSYQMSYEAVLSDLATATNHNKS